jgi:uncharacterized damage-inducible protein DinB
LYQQNKKQTVMQIIPILLKEMEQEAQTTRKMLALVPIEQADWAPHAKSMKMGHLAMHIAELPGWVSMALNTDELDFASFPYEQPVLSSAQAALDMFEKGLAAGKADLEKTNDDVLAETWTLRTGDNIHAKMTKAEMVRVAYSQMVHHRAQLGVYLRLLNIPIPGSYGPSADELGM